MGWKGISGPKDAGPSEREQMLAMAAEVFAEAGVANPTRIDVPGRGAGSSGDGGTIREQVAAIVPALQSGSLFGGSTGVLVMDAQNLLKAESAAVAELLAVADPDQVVAVFASSGAMPAALKKTIGSDNIVSLRALRTQDSLRWLNEYAKQHRLRIDAAARDELVKHFGANQAAMRRAIDSLAISGSTIEAEAIAATIDNRPNEPVWLLGDAIMTGNHTQALRRLADYLEHNHPLILLSYLEGEVRRRSLAAVAPDYDTFATWARANPASYATKKVWEGRTRANGEALASCVRALARADLTLKTQPEATHRVTMERLTVAMSRWMAR
ncbi:MAG: hypothetical protein R2823_10595 [Acidimicrobiia bacterium]